MIVLTFVLAGICLAIDLITKAVFYGQSFSLIGDFLWIETSFNEGAAFGQFQGGKWIFLALAIIVVGFICYLVISRKIKSKTLSVGLALLLGGIIGNAIDRVIFSGVRDFIYFKFINFAIFNMADAFITIGTILVIVYILFLYKPAKKEEKNDRH